MNKLITRITVGGALLLTLSLSLAMPAEAQHQGRGPVPMQGHAASGPAAISRGAVPMQRFAPQNFQRPMPRTAMPDFRRDGRQFTGIDQRFTDQRFTDQRFTDQRFTDRRFTDQRFTNQRFDARRPDLGRGEWRHDGRPFNGLPFNGHQFDGRHDGRFAYRENRDFRGPGYIDPYARIRGGRGFFRYGDVGFYNRQFETRWGSGWYGRTHGEWARHRVGGRWPWMPFGLGVGIGFYNGWGFNGIDIVYANGDGYYALDGFCPTEYIYTVDRGSYWRPDGDSWYGRLPSDYDAPITVAVREVVPVTDEYGNVVGYESHLFYYNAYFDDESGEYGYYDYEGDFHLVR